ncbi:MAG: hypothetical protein JNK67_23555 [Alphaproteobacteria bacterium]|nr:hypothetical protein [Alphaproteobacteria bacterium]
MLDERQIERRRPVWTALSALWLDTELDDAGLRAIAAVLRESGLPRDELQRIYAVELAPVLGANLLGVAGEWAGFDPTWLSARILDNLRRRPRRTRFWAWFPPTRRAWTYATGESWRRILAFLDESA